MGNPVNFESANENVQKFSKECIAAGASLQKLEAVRIQGRGMGVIATEPINAGETLIEIPISLLIYPEMVPDRVRSRFPNITVHGLLAAVLARPELVNRDWSSWKTVMNTQDEFQASIPLLWSPSLQELLPWPSKDILAKQKKKIQSDWTIVSNAIPDLDEKTYTYNWLLVNTRTFYFLHPSTGQKKESAECLAMCPYIDLINHSNDGCKVSFTADGYTLKSQQAYTAGEEITFTYGGHSNDFLLTEYGFILSENTYDFLKIDPYILPFLDEPRSTLLQEHGFLGNYTLDNSGVCHRTEVALRTIILSTEIWDDFRNGERDGSQEQGSVNLLVLRVLEKIRRDVIIAQSKLEDERGKAEGFDRDAVDLLSRRWSQILDMVDKVEGSLDT